MRYFIGAFKNFSFKGRIGRKEFILFYLIMCVLMFPFSIVEENFELYIISTEFNHIGALTAIYWFVVIVPWFSMVTKRLHDINRSGEWNILMLIPIARSICLIYLFAKKGDPGENKYGESPIETVKDDGTVSVKEKEKFIQEFPKQKENAIIEVLCAQCGYKMTEQTPICPNCGEAVERIEVSSVMIKESDESVTDDSEFCQYCGMENEDVGSEKIVAIQATSVVEEIEENELETRNDNIQCRTSYCKLCGNVIDKHNKKCTGCGKKYVTVNYKLVCVLAIVLVLIIGYIGINYIGAISAMDNQEFIKAQKKFDNLLVSETVFAEKYAFVEAGVLLEKENFTDALVAFTNLDSELVDESIVEGLKSKIYEEGKKAYREENLEKAKENFELLDEYKRSSDYYLLSISKGNGLWTYAILEERMNQLIDLIDFEDTADIILKYQESAMFFLKGIWEDGSSRYPYYFEMIQNVDGSYSSYYNLPDKNAEGYFYISEGIYAVGETEESASKYYKFTIIDEDTISVYCYKDGSTYKLYRQ